MSSRRLAAALLVALLSALSSPARAADAEPIDTLALRKASSHPMRYFLSLPRGYVRQAGKKWPLLVVLPGKALSPFESTAADYREKRGELPFILVVPCTFLNAEYNIPEDKRAVYRQYYGDMEPPKGEVRLTWDEDGVLAIIKDMQTTADAEPKTYLTGFSSGATLTYHMILTRPELLAGAVTVCGNFEDFGYNYHTDRKPPPSDALGLPVHIFLGENDPLRFEPSPPRKVELFHFLVGAAITAAVAWPLWRGARRPKLALGVFVLGTTLAAVWVATNVREEGNEAQSAEAIKLLHEFGYSNVQRTVVPRMGHDASPNPVLETLRPFWEPAKK